MKPLGRLENAIQARKVEEERGEKYIGLGEAARVYNNMAVIFGDSGRSAVIDHRSV